MAVQEHNLFEELGIRLVAIKMKQITEAALHVQVVIAPRFQAPAGAWGAAEGPKLFQRLTDSYGYLTKQACLGSLPPLFCTANNFAEPNTMLRRCSNQWRILKDNYVIVQSGAMCSAHACIKGHCLSHWRGWAMRVTDMAWLGARAGLLPRAQGVRLWLRGGGAAGGPSDARPGGVLAAAVRAAQLHRG